MPPVVSPPSEMAVRIERQLFIMRLLMAVLTAVAVLLVIAYFAGVGEPGSAQAAEVAGGDGPGAAAAPATTSTSTTTPDTTTPDTTPPTTTFALSPGAPPRDDRYIAPPTETEPGAKQLAADIAYALTTYEEADDPTYRFTDIVGAVGGVDALAGAAAPLTYQGQWSRGEIVYPQLGGLENQRTSVMVVTRQTVGAGRNAQFSVVRTIDIRLVLGDSGWEFDALASAGGTFDTLEDLELAHAVANDPRIEMPDSARLDIRAGLISPRLLGLMQELADLTPYGITVMATGHPYHVFETDRISHHTLGRAIDIYLVDDALVVDDRSEGSTTRTVVEWLHEQPDVVQVGSPWDLDDDERRSFADVVHQDHIHVAVVEET